MTLYRFSELERILGIDETWVEIDDSESIALFENYRTYGGGGAGCLNAHYGKKHSEESKGLMRQKAIGRPAWNKGISNPEHSERMKANNPMKRSEISQKVAEKNRSKPRLQKTRTQSTRTFGPDGQKKTVWTLTDGTIFVSENTRLTCEQYGLPYSAVRHKIGKGPYTTGRYKGLRIDKWDYTISHAPETQLSS